MSIHVFFFFSEDSEHKQEANKEDIELASQISFKVCIQVKISRRIRHLNLKQAPLNILTDLHFLRIQ